MSAGWSMPDPDNRLCYSGRRLVLRGDLPNGEVFNADCGAGSSVVLADPDGAQPRGRFTDFSAVVDLFAAAYFHMVSAADGAYVSDPLGAGGYGVGCADS